MIKILNISNNYPISDMGKYAGICWNADISDINKNFKRGVECLESGHHRVMEYSDVVVEISEYSARMIRELYTHIIGVTRLQESTRYVDCSNFKYYTPDSIKYKPLALNNYDIIMKRIKEMYVVLQDMEIPIQDIANILPLGMHTKIVLKINCRALMHMAGIRMCKRAYKEFREFMGELRYVLSEITEEWAYFVHYYMRPKCEILGYCNEKQSCKKYLKEKEEERSND